MTPSLLSLASPFHLARRSLRTGLRRHAPALQGKVLDVGCGTKPYRDLFPDSDYVGIEVNRVSKYGSARHPDVYFDGRNFPIADGSVDSVLCSQVLEHVFEPAQFLGEIHRVLRPGGRLLLTVPFVWDEHEQPFDYGRYTSFGLEYLMSKAGFRQLAHERTLANASIFVQLWLASLEKSIRRWPRLARAAILATVVIPCNLVGMILDAVSANHGDLYLDNVALFERTNG